MAQGNTGQPAAILAHGITGQSDSYMVNGNIDQPAARPSHFADLSTQRLNTHVQHGPEFSGRPCAASYLPESCRSNSQLQQTPCVTCLRIHFRENGLRQCEMSQCNHAQSSIQSVLEQDFSVIGQDGRIRQERFDLGNGICIICKRREINIHLHPCSHEVTCHICTRSVRRCPLCRDRIVSFSRY